MARFSDDEVTRSHTWGLERLPPLLTSKSDAELANKILSKRLVREAGQIRMAGISIPKPRRRVLPKKKKAAG